MSGYINLSLTIRPIDSQKKKKKKKKERKKKKKKKEKKKTFRIGNFAIPADHRIKRIRKER